MQDSNDNSFFHDIEIRWGAALPHWFKPGAIYSVTFRLADSLPSSVLASWDQEIRDIYTRATDQGRGLTPFEQEKIKHFRSHRSQDYLDSGRGACYFNDPRIAKIVMDAFLFFENQRYRLFAWCIMPNHVHVVLEPREGHPLGDILKSWKTFTAKKANQILKRTGAFWQAESFDRIIRNQQELGRALEYVRDNPIKAGLKDWPWVWVRSPELPV